MSEKFQPFMQALLWTCKSCGFVYEGGQPKMNCPVCESYKSSFIDIPQHLEAQIRETFPDVSPNHRDARALRLKLMKDTGAVKKASVAGRVLPSQSGEHINPSEVY